MNHLRITTALVGAAMLAALGGCGEGASKSDAVDTAKVGDAVKADVAALISEYNAGDAAKAATHDAPDYIGMQHGMANVVGMEADQAAMTRIMADKTNKFEAPDGTVTVSKAGDIAIYEAPYTAHWTDPKTKALKSETGNWIAIYKAQADGTMKLSRSISVDTPAAAEGAAAATPEAAPAAPAT